MNKKFGLLYSLVLIVSLMTTSCGNSDDDLVGNWVVATTDFAGKARAFATSFVVGNKLYVFGGYNGKENMNDLWSLDTSSDNGGWTQLAALDASATVINSATAHYGRKNAVGFAIGTDGFVGTGNNDNIYMNDFWKYDTKTGTWTQIADFPGAARYGSYSFALNSKGYVGGGKNDDGYFNDYYVYNPATASWTTTVTTVGKKRAYASTFVIGNTAYLFGGVNSSGNPTDMSAFDGTTWTSKRAIANEKDDSFDDNYTTIARSLGSTFVVNGKGYLSCGMTTSSSLKNTWEYDPTNDLWTERTAFERSTVRTGAIGATINGKGAILTGLSGSSYLDDVNLFSPTDTYNKND